nr:MAG TPA: Spermatogenesis-associated protein 3 family [Caudoviricetes sp.]
MIYRQLYPPKWQIMLRNLTTNVITFYQFR